MPASQLGPNSPGPHMLPLSGFSHLGPNSPALQPSLHVTAVPLESWQGPHVPNSPEPLHVCTPDTQHGRVAPGGVHWAAPASFTMRGLLPPLPPLSEPGPIAPSPLPLPSADELPPVPEGALLAATPPLALPEGDVPFPPRLLESAPLHAAASTSSAHEVSQYRIDDFLPRTRGSATHSSHYRSHGGERHATDRSHPVAAMCPRRAHVRKVRACAPLGRERRKCSSGVVRQCYSGAGSEGAGSMRVPSCCAKRWKSLARSM